MKEITLVLGLPGSGREAAAVKEAGAAVRNQKSVLWITDSLRRQERTEEKLLQHLGGAYGGLEVLVASRLPQWLLRQHGKLPPTVAVEVRQQLFYRLLERVSGTPGEPHPRGHGWARHVAELYARRYLQAQQATPDGTDRELEQRLRGRFPWLTELFAQYDRALEENALHDEAHLPMLAQSELQENRTGLPELLIVDRLGPLPHALEQLLLMLAGRAGRCLVLVDQCQGAGPALQEACLLEQRWRACGVPHQEQEFPRREKAETLARELFSLAPNQDRLGPALDTVRLRYGSSRSEEVRWVAGELARLQHEEGVPEEQLAVVCTRLEEYAPLIRELFDQYGLRIDQRLGARLMETHSAQLALTLLKLRVEGFDRESVTQMLANPLVRYGSLLAQRAGVLALDSAARGARIREGGPDFQRTWEEPLSAYVQRLGTRGNLRTETDGEEEEKPFAPPEQDPQWVTGALAELKALATRISALPDPVLPREVAEWLNGLFTSLGALQRMHGSKLPAPFRAKNLRAHRRMLLLLEHMSDTTILLGEVRLDLGELQDLFRASMHAQNLAEPGKLFGGIPVVGPLDARGLRARHVYTLGMVESAWPRRPELNLLDPLSGSWLQNDRLAESRALTWELICANDHTTFTSPCQEDGESDDAPSPFMGELAAAGAEVLGQEDDIVYRSALDLLPALGRDAAHPSLRERLQRRLAAASVAGWTGVLWQHVPETLNVQGRREDPTVLSVHEGQLQGSPFQQLIAAHFSARTLSATHMERYAQCPMRYLFSRLLRVEELEEVEERLDARELGGLVHDIMARTALKLKQERGAPAALAEEPEQTRRVLASVARELVETHDYHNLEWDRLVHKLTAGLERADEEFGVLRMLLEDHINRLKEERISLVEAAFGLPPGELGESLLPGPVVVNGEGVQTALAGRIDRVDLHPDKGWRIWDYKLASKIFSAGDIRDGLAFQLPVYMLALETWRQQQGEQSPDQELSIADAQYYKLKKNMGEKPSHSGRWTAKSQAEYADRIRSWISSISRAMSAGRFHQPLSQHKKLCDRGDYNHCPYKGICRRDHELFEAREHALPADQLHHAYILPFQEGLAIRAGAGEGL